MSFRRPGSLYRMGKLTYGMNVSVDGYIVDSNGDFSWSEPDDEVHQFWNDRVGETAVSLYGRKLYELMSAYWPTAEQDPDITPVTAEYARLWLAMPKVVFSQTLSSVDWNSRLERGDVVEVAERLKAETDGILDVAGATLAAPLIGKPGGRVPGGRQPRRGRQRHTVLPHARPMGHPRPGGEPHLRRERLGPPPLRPVPRLGLVSKW